VALAVLEDHHLLGKRMVLSVLRSAGVGVLDYGSVGVAELAARAVRDGVEVVLVSALMLRSALKVKELIERLGGPARSVRVAVGGAPFRLDAELWKEVGADAVGLSAAEAPAIVAQLLPARATAEASR
jgi:methanogenic corrinoid protein MtbC1